MKFCRFAAFAASLTLLAISFAEEARIPVPIGTELDIATNTPLSTQFSQPGDQFTADVSDGPYKGGIVHGTVNQSGH